MDAGDSAFCDPSQPAHRGQVFSTHTSQVRICLGQRLPRSQKKNEKSGRERTPSPCSGTCLDARASTHAAPRVPDPRPTPPGRSPRGSGPRTHLVVVVLAEAEALGEDRKDGEGRAGEGRPEPELLRRGGGGGGCGAGRAALDVVVLGEAHALVRADAVVAQVLLAVEAARRGRVALVAGAAAVRPAQQQRRRGGRRAAGR